MSERADKAMQTYMKNYNCAQAVFCAYADMLGLDDVQAFRLSEGFGGGMGLMQETCGALTAVFMVVSGLHSDGLLEDGKTKMDTYKKIRKTTKYFKNVYGCISCKDLLNGTRPKHPECADKVAVATEIMEKMIRELKPEALV